MIFAGELKTQFGSKNCVLAGEIIAGELKIAVLAGEIIAGELKIAWFFGGAGG